MDEDGRDEYSYFAKFARSPTIHVDIKKINPKKATDASEFSSNLTTKQICALYLTVGDFLKINQKLSKPAVFDKSKPENPIETKMKIYETEGNHNIKRPPMLDVFEPESPSNHSYQAKVFDKHVEITIMSINFEVMGDNTTIRVSLIYPFMEEVGVFPKPPTFKELCVFWVAIGDFLSERGKNIKKKVRVYRKMPTTVIEIGYDDDEDNDDNSGGKHGGKGDVDGDLRQAERGSMMIDMADGDEVIVLDGDDGGGSVAGGGSKPRTRQAREWAPFPGESDQCVQRRAWLRSIDVRNNIFRCIRAIRCCGNEIVIDSHNSKITKNDLLTISSGEWANGEIVEWGFRYFGRISTGNKSQTYEHLVACRPRGQPLTLIFGLFYMDMWVDQGADSGKKAFNTWFGGCEDRFLAAPKWFMPVNKGKSHYFFMVVWLEEKRVEVYDSIRQDVYFYDKYFKVAKMTAEAAARHSGKEFADDWSLTVNQEFPRQEDSHSCAFAMLCGIYDQLTGGPMATSGDDYVQLRRTLAEVMYRKVPERFKVLVD